MTRTRVRPATRCLCAVGAALVLVLVGCGKGPGGTVALVNGRRVTRAQLSAELERDYGPLALRTLADRAIARQVAAAKGLKPDPKRVEYLLSQEEAVASSRQALEQRLAREHRTLDDLRRDLEQQALSEQAVASEVQVGGDEVKSYYEAHRNEFRHGEMVKARMMLFGSRANAEAVRGVLSDPRADFAGLARELSDDPGTKSQGGDMGWFERQDYARELTDVAFRLAPGQCSGVIAYPDGYAILLVEARKPAGRQSLDQVRGTIEGLIRRDKEAELRNTWAAEQRKRANIEVHEDSLRRAFELIRGS